MMLDRTGTKRLGRGLDTESFIPRPNKTQAKASILDGGYQQQLRPLGNPPWTHLQETPTESRRKKDQEGGARDEDREERRRRSPKTGSSRPRSESQLSVGVDVMLQEKERSGHKEKKSLSGKQSDT